MLEARGTMIFSKGFVQDISTYVVICEILASHINMYVSWMSYNGIRSILICLILYVTYYIYTLGVLAYFFYMPGGVAYYFLLYAYFFAPPAVRNGSRPRPQPV